MKKILALILAFVIVLSLCACAGAPATGNSDNGGASQTPAGDSGSDNAGTSSDSGSTSQGTGVVGTWKVIPPTTDAFPPFILILNEDGTGSWGTNLNKMEDRLWYADEDDDAVEGQIEISREDNYGWGNDAYITEDGKLYMKYNLTVNGDKSYDHLVFERQ